MNQTLKIVAALAVASLATSTVWAGPDDAKVETADTGYIDTGVVDYPPGKDLDEDDTEVDTGAWVDTGPSDDSGPWVDTGPGDTDADDTGAGDTDADDTSAADSDADDTSAADSDADDTSAADTDAEDTGAEDSGGEDTYDTGADADDPEEPSSYACTATVRNSSGYVVATPSATIGRDMTGTYRFGRWTVQVSCTPE